MWKRISTIFNKITGRGKMAKPKKEEEVNLLTIDTVVDVIIPNSLDSGRLEYLSIREIKDSLLAKRKSLTFDDFDTKFVVDMGLEEGSSKVYLFEVSVKTRYKDDAYFQNRKQLMYTIRKKFNSPIDVEVLEFYHTLISILP
jgi:hypothetical protein